MAEINVHPRVHRRHPEVCDEDVVAAWRNAVAVGRRNEGGAHVFVAVGFDSKGRLLELVASLMDDGACLIFHGMRATKKTLIELGIEGRRPL